MESKADKAKMAEAEETEEREDTKREEGNFRKPMVVEEMVSRRFYKYLKVFEKKLKRIPMRKT